MDSIILCLGIVSLFLRDLVLWSWQRLTLSFFVQGSLSLWGRLFLVLSSEWGGEGVESGLWAILIISPLHCPCLDAIKDTKFLVAKLLIPDFPRKISRWASSSWSLVKWYDLISGFTNGVFPSIHFYTRQSPVVKCILKTRWNLFYSTAFPFQGNHREGGEAGSRGARCGPRAKPWLGLLDTLKDLKKALLH